LCFAPRLRLVRHSRRQPTRQACQQAVDLAVRSSQFFNQLNTERDWEQARKPYYNVWPSIVPMLTPLSLDLDSALIQLPMPALSIRLPVRVARPALRHSLYAAV
jgi:polyphosphate kinase